MTRLTLTVLLGAAAFCVALPSAQAEEKCKNTRGRITSEVVAEFSDGTPCPSLVGICTEGRYSGRLSGKFRFIAKTLTFANSIDPDLVGPPAPGTVAFTTGDLLLAPHNCRGGVLVFRDGSAFGVVPAVPPADEQYFASVQTLDPAASSADCGINSGQLRAAGVFSNGCVDCEYEGVVCKTRD